MTAPPDFFRQPAVLRLLERAAAVTAVPLSLHVQDRKGGESRILGWGGCRACRWVNAREAGAAACRASRARAGRIANQQDVPVTYVCHLGLMCVSAPALAGSNYQMTFGPYIPAEMSEAVAQDMARGVAAIGAGTEEVETLPFATDDIRLAPTGTVSAAAEWLLEGLRAGWAAFERADEPREAATEAHITETVQEKPKHETLRPGHPPSGWLPITAMALLCGRTRHVRAALEDLLEEEMLTGNTGKEHLQAQLIQVVSAVIDAAREMGGEVETAWGRYAAFVQTIRGIEDHRIMLNKAIRILSLIHPAPGGRHASIPPYLPEVIDYIYRNYANKAQLTAIAEMTGLAASTISRVIAHRTGANFSEFLGRVRIMAAKRLLRRTRLSAATVGARVGIADQSNFGKLFARYVGCTPGEYRRRMGVN